MTRTYKFRLYPTKAQRRMMLSTLESCRVVYNTLLENRKTRWEQEKKPTSLYEQNKQTTEMRQSGLNVHSQVLYDVARRIDLAFNSFFRRVKSGGKPGFPRFKAKGRYNSFTYPQITNNQGRATATRLRIENGRIQLPKIGPVKVRGARLVEGMVKNMSVKTSNEKWYVTIVSVNTIKKIPMSNMSVGIDVGLSQFATLSDGTKIANPRFFKQEEKALKKAQRKRKRKATARIHERIVNKRHNFCHQESRRIVNEFGIIAFEDLTINNMIENAPHKNRRKSINDVAWGMFLSQLAYKAEEAGRTTIAVNPAYTSQTCRKCGQRKQMPLSVRVFECACGEVVDRDLNAACNILRLGLQSLSGNAHEALCN